MLSALSEARFHKSVKSGEVFYAPQGIVRRACEWLALSRLVDCTGDDLQPYRREN
jgi:hypothetical protein